MVIHFRIYGVTDQRMFRAYNNIISRGYRLLKCDKTDFFFIIIKNIADTNK